MRMRRNWNINNAANIMPLFLYIIQYLFSENKDSLLRNHSTMIKVWKFNIDVILLFHLFSVFKFCQVP